jgi:hypothetical protein
MVKSLLLGGAAGLVAVAGAQAADLPMKAKAPAVQYVKICTLYGAGFYYIPGTDTCIKIGGYIRTQVEYNAGGGGIAIGSGGVELNQGRMTRADTNDVNYRNRAVVTFDVRTQGEYGVLRSYYQVGWAVETPATSAAGTTANAYWDRAFIQFAGFTVGKAQSFFDIYHHGGSRNYLNTRTSGDNGASGLMLWAYTAQFGGGFSASFSVEDPRGHNLFGVRQRGAVAGVPLLGTTIIGGLNYGAPSEGLASNCAAATGAPTCFGFQIPDFVANLRYDQPWGFVGVSGALHLVAGDYYLRGGGRFVGNGSPGDKWGYALGVGGQLNVPGMPGDTVGAMFRWGTGTPGYIIGAGAGSWLLVDGGGAGRAFTVDAIFATPGTVPGVGGQLFLTDAWSINAHYEHAWTPALRTSVYGGYAAIEYPGGAKRLICGGACGVLNPDFGFWQVGSRTQWAPWKGQLNVGVDVVYTAIDSAIYAPRGVPVGVGGAQTAKVVRDTDVISVMFRVQRNWFP